MLPFLTIFIVFCIVLTYYIKKSDNAQQKAMDEFWEKEHQSNAVRKKDISNLNYITIPFDKIPVKLNTDTEEKLIALSEKPMLNLTGLSNTDLKLAYGTANLEILSSYDLNFTNMVALLPEYVSELLDAGQTQDARMLLEFAIECNADSRRLYQQLASIYVEANEPNKLVWLSEHAESLPEFTKKAVIKDLSIFMQQ